MGTRRPALALFAALALGAAVPSAAAALSLPVAAVDGGTLGVAKLEAAAGGRATLSAPALTLAPGAQFALRTCLQTHVLGSPPRAQCSSRDIDMRNAAGPALHAAPVVSSEATNATDAQVAWAAGRVDVFTFTGPGASALQATTLPAGSAGLPQAIDLRPSSLGAETLAYQGASTGQGSGGINSGGIGSMCIATPFPVAGPVPGDLQVDALGTDAPAYSELGAPLNGAAPVGVALTLHGGGWYVVGQGAAEQERPAAERWRRRGWLTVNASHRPCADAPADVRWFVERIRARYPSLPLCIAGASSGGHLGLLVASELPDAVDCVVGEGAPVRLASLPSQPAYGSSTGATQTSGPLWVFNVAVAAFGSENLDAFSPRPDRLRARVLLGTAAQDTLVPPGQATELRNEVLARDPAADVGVLQLAAGPLAWTHGSVSEAALGEFAAREDAIAAAAVRDHAAPPVTPPPPPVPPPPAAVPPPPPVVPPPAVAPLPATVRVVAAGRRSVLVEVRATGRGRVELALSLAAADAKRLGLPRQVRKLVRTVSAGRQRVRVALGDRVRRALSRRSRPLAASLRSRWLLADRRVVELGTRGLRLPGGR